MSERVGTCAWCKGVGQVWVPIPNHPQVVKASEATEDELKELRALRTGADKRPIIEVSRRFFVRPCTSCEGTAGYSGEAEEITRI